MGDRRFVLRKSLDPNLLRVLCAGFTVHVRVYTRKTTEPQCSGAVRSERIFVFIPDDEFVHCVKSRFGSI